MTSRGSLNDPVASLHAKAELGGGLLRLSWAYLRCMGGFRRFLSGLAFLSGTEPEDFVVCRECGGRFLMINNHLIVHNITPKEYRTVHSGAPQIALCVRRKMSETRQKNNPAQELPFCQCGCGEHTHSHKTSFLPGHVNRIRKYRKTAKTIELWRKKYLKGFYRRKWADIPGWLFFLDNPLCLCGCGERTSCLTNRYIQYHGDKGAEHPSMRGHIPWNKGKEMGKWKKTRESVERGAETLKRNRRAPIPWWFWEKFEYPLCECGCQERVPNYINRYIYPHKVHSPITRQKIGKKVKAHWGSLTPDEQKDYLNNSFFKAKAKPNGEERRLIPILSKLGFNYNTFAIIGSRRPDFVHFNGIQLIEYDGAGGHDPRVPQVPKNKPELDDLRDQDYRKAGKKILRLFPKDLQLGKEHIIQKVKKWIGDDLFEYPQQIDIEKWFR